MGILFRYIFREIIVSTLVGTLLFTFVLFLRSVGRVMELLIGPSASTEEVLYLFLLTLPQTLRFTIPIGVLIGVLVGLGRLSTDGEITAMRAAGIPGRRLVSPVALLACLGVIACAATTLHVNPLAQREWRRIGETLKISQATAEIAPRVFIESFPHAVLYVRDVIPGEIIRWKGVFMADMRAPEARGSFGGVNAGVEGPSITVAEEAIAVPRLEQNRIQLSLTRAIRYEQSHDPQEYYFQLFGEADQVLEIQQSGPAISVRPFDHMDTPELMGREELEARIELHQRFAFPFACLVFPMVGIPLAISSQQSGRSVGVVFSVLLVFIYWMIWLGGVAMANAGIVPVTVAVWSANVLFALAGTLLLAQLDAPNRRDIAAALLGRLRELWSRLRANGDDSEEALDRPEALPAPLASRPQRAKRSVSAVPLFPIVDRYILRTFLYYFLVLVAAFVMIWFVFSFFELLSDMLERQKMGLFIPYIYYLTPFLVYETAPLGVLVATLVCFFVLAKHHELTALKASGISLYRAAMPILVVSLAFSGALFFLDNNYLPETNRRQDAIRDEIKGRPARTFLRPDRQWTFGQKDRIFYHRFFDFERNVLAGVSVYDFDAGNFQLRRHISAERARWDDAQSAWVFENGWVREIQEDRVTGLESFEAKVFPSIEEKPGYFLKEQRQHQQMNLAELRDYIVDLTQSGFDTARLQVELHKKVAFPLFAFIMAVLAVPFSLVAGHRGTFAGVVLAIGLAVSYYALDAFFEQLGRANRLTPAIAAWAPSVIFGLCGAYLFMRVRS